MSARVFEVVLARLYSDATLRNDFLREPAAVLALFDLTPAERAALLEMDRAGLVLAARSFAHKRERYGRKQRGWQRLTGWLRTFRTRARKS